MALKREIHSTRLSGTKVWLVLWKASRSVSTYAQSSIASLDMCTTDFAVLESLLHKGPLPVNTIGRKVLVTSGSITLAVDRLVERGLVERFDDANDRRVRLVRLTNEGLKLIKSAFARHEKHLDRMVAALDQSELSTLVNLLKKLGQEAEQLLAK